MVAGQVLTRYYQVSNILLTKLCVYWLVRLWCGCGCGCGCRTGEGDDGVVPAILPANGVVWQGCDIQKAVSARYWLCKMILVLQFSILLCHRPRAAADIIDVRIKQKPKKRKN